VAPADLTLPASPRPSPAELAAAAGARIVDVIGPDLDVLFCGINPGLWSGAVGQHFARPGNRFWKVLHGAGFTDRVLRPSEQDELLGVGVGLTNLVERATATAAELAPDELRAGAGLLADKVTRYRPKAVAVVGLGAYRTAFGRPRAGVGRQVERLEGAELWALPNPSGLQAHYQLDDLVAAYAELRRATAP
jgi:TDG/mug DNA glycosylase family protein